MFRKKSLAGVAITLAVTLWAQMANAESAATSATAALTRGVELLRSFEYDAAIEQFRLALEAEDATPPERLRALERLGATYFNTEHPEQARERFEQLLDNDPNHTLTERTYPPPVQQFYDEIREAYEPTTVAVLSGSAEEVAAGEVAFNAQLTRGAEAVAEVAILARTDQGEFLQLDSSLSGAEAVAALQAPEGSVVEYYLEARAPSGAVLAQLGSQESPQTVEIALSEPIAPPVEEPSGRPWYRTWWFWTVIGVVVAGGATATALALTLPGDPPQGSLGSGQLE